MLASSKASPLCILSRFFSSLQCRILSKPRPELEGWISQSCCQYFRLHIISPILSAMFAWFALCFCFQPTRLSLLFLHSTQRENGTLLVQAVFAVEYVSWISSVKAGNSNSNFRDFAEKTVEIFQNWHRGKYLQQRHYLKLQIPPFWKSPSRDG